MSVSSSEEQESERPRRPDPAQEPTPLVFSADRRSHRDMRLGDQVYLWQTAPDLLILTLVDITETQWHCDYWILRPESQHFDQHQFVRWALNLAGYDPFSWFGERRRIRKQPPVMLETMIASPVSFFMRRVLAGG